MAIIVFLELQIGALILPYIGSGRQPLLVDAGMTYGRQQDEVLLADDLGVDVLVVVPVQGRDGPRVADPEVGGVGVLLEGYPGEGDVSRHVLREGQVLVAEVVVLCLGMSGQS